MTVGVPSSPRLGLRANWEQFLLLVLVNAFVGGMIGLERVVVPLLAEQEFGLASKAVILSFILSFGLVKALTNLAAGHLSDRLGRKGVLIAGWLIGLPAPLLVMVAPTWEWVVAANVLLGLNQGLCWSATVIMKIDLVGPAQRGLAMGLNEAAGYLAVALTALAGGYVAAVSALRPYPFFIGIALAAAGLLLSSTLVRETRGHARHEAALAGAGPPSGSALSFGQIMLLTSWKNRNLFAASQAGLVNNLNDGLAWGLLPLAFTAAGLSLERTSLLAAAYPAVWGLGQLGAGALSDRVGRKWPIAAGMWLQAASLGLFALGRGFWPWLVAAVGLGLGTALVYPTLLATIGDAAHPDWRASAVGVYRLWRDSGYVVGALLAGLLADWLGIAWTIGIVAGLTALSGMVAAAVMSETMRAA